MIGKTEWERLSKASEGSLKETEAFLSYLVEHYLKPDGVPAEKLAVEIPAAFARTARAVLLARDLEKDPINLEKVETKLRSQLEPGPFPPRFTAVTTQEKVARAKPASGAAIEPDSLPALSFADGAVVQDVSVVARTKKLVIGCRVSALRDVRGVKKGGGGTLTGLGKEALVMWDEGALADGGEGQQEKLIPIASVAVATAPEKPPEKPAEKPPPVQLPVCMPWDKLAPAMAAQGLEQLVVGALYQVFANRSATPDQVAIESEGAGRIFANIEVKPRGLMVLPHVHALGDDVGPDRVRDGDTNTTKPEIWVKVGGDEYRYMLVAPTASEAVDAEPRGDAEAGESPPNAEADDSQLDAEAGESPPVVDLFWRLHNSAKAKAAPKSRGELIRANAELAVSAGCATIKDPDLRAAGKKPAGGITIWVPYLTNKVELYRGDELWVKKQKVE